MATALYRRYRPETFAELIGQTQVTDPLRAALRADRVGHAYLFSGPRGCGKTTSARILARCLNCVQGPTDAPCGTCASCVELSRGGGGSLDVVEIDAASHGGVDDARDLRERAIFAPARDRYKIFIIDEAHMVTSGGFNALLKIVEEPPEHVKFIFATTEPEKVIGTIRSRTHHYPFRLVPPAQMLDYVQQLCESEGVQVEPGVLPLVVRAGGGSVRDTLSLLDQLIAGSDNTTVAYARAVALLGYTPAALLDETVDALGARDAAALFAAIDRVVQTGQDPRRFVDDLLERLRDLIVVAATRDSAAAVLRGVPQDELDRMAAQATAFGSAELSRAADIVNDALTAMTGATSPRLQLELMAARLLVPAADEPVRGALARVERLERRIGIEDSGAAERTPAPERESAPAAQAAPAAAAEAAPAAAAQAAPAAAAEAAPSVSPSARSGTGRDEAPVTLQQIKDAWPEVLEVVKKTKMGAWMVVYTATPRAYADDVLTLAFRSENDVAAFRPRATAPGDNVSELLRGAIQQVLGVRVKFLPRVEAGPRTPEPAAKPEPAADAEPAHATGPEAEPVVDPEAEPVVDREAAPVVDPEPESVVDPEPESTVDLEAGPEPELEPELPPAAASAAPTAPASQASEPAPRSRYGEAVVRELLGANFIGEQSLASREATMPLGSADRPEA